MQLHILPKGISPYAIPGLTGNRSINPHDYDNIVSEIIRVVCEEYNISVESFNKILHQKKLLGGKRKRGSNAIIHSLHVCMYVLKENTPASLQKTGDCFGKRNHSTVLCGVRVVKNLISVYLEDRRRMNTILFRLGYPQLESITKWELK